MAQKLNPFPGLRPFEMQEKYLFFGREDQTIELLKRLGQARFMAVVGTSGSGKSSLVRAGLLPELHGGTMTDAGSSWEIAVMRPGGDPLTNLAKSLEDSGIYDTDEEGYYRHLRAMLGRSTMGLIEAVSQSSLEKEDNLLIVVDQFEEIFRFRSSSGKHAEEAANFISLLLEATQQTSKSIFVTITMRSDFLGDCSQFRGLAEAVNEGEYLIPRLNRNQRRLAIEGPVKVGGKQIEARLIQQLLNDIGDDPDQLPILQHALMRTWEYHEKAGGQGALDLEHYEATGGMKEALSRHADEVYAELKTDEQRTYCERIFKALTERVSGGRGIRRPMAMSELAEVVGVDNPDKLLPVIEAYRAAGRTFLMPPDSVELGHKVVVDISHESLMRVWQHLVGWVDEEAQSARIYRRLADTAQLFKENKAGLYRDPDLQISLSWRDQNNPTEAWADRYYPGYKDAMAFLDESHETAIAEEKAKEEARKRELKQARRLAEEERRSKSLWQKLVFTFGVAVLAITVGLFYIIDSRETIRNNLSRVSLKQANRLAESNQQDEAIAVLAKTIKDNPSYHSAGIRLISLLEQTAMPRNVKKIYSPQEFEPSGSNGGILVNAINEHIVEFGLKDKLNRCKVLNFNGTEIYSYTTTNQISGGVLSEDGNLLFYGQRDYVKDNYIITMINLTTKEKSDFSKLNGARGFDITGDGKLLSTYNQNGSFSVLETKSGNIIFNNTESSSNDRRTYRSAFSKNGDYVAQSIVGANTAYIKVYDINSGDSSLIREIDMDQGMQFVGFTDGDNYLTTAHWMIKNNEFSFGRDMYPLKKSPDINVDLGFKHFPVLNNTFFNDSYIIAGSSGGELAGFFSGGKIIRMDGHRDAINDVDLSSDGMLIASGSRDRTVRLWSVETGDQISIPIRFEEAVMNLSFGKDGNSLYATVAGGNIYRVDGPFLKLEPTFKSLPGGPSANIYNPAIDQYAHLNSAYFSFINFKNGDEQRIPVNNVNLRTSRNRFSYSMGVDWDKEIVTYLTFNSTSNFIAKSINLDSGETINETLLPQSSLHASINYDGSKIAILKKDGEVTICDLNKENDTVYSMNVGKVFRSIEYIGNQGLVLCKNLLSGQVFDCKNNRKLGSLLRGGRSITAKYYNDATTCVLAQLNSPRVQFINVNNGRSNTINLEGGFSRGISVNNKETIVAISSSGGLVKFYDLRTHKLVSGTLAHKSDVDGIVFHPVNDRYVFTYAGEQLYGWDRFEQNVFMGPVKIMRGWDIFINNTGSKITCRNFSGKLNRIPIHIPNENTNYDNWLPSLANSLIGFSINEFDAKEIYNKDFEISNVPNDMKSWVDWVSDKSSERYAGPSVDIKLSDLIDELSQSTSLHQLRQALRLRPNHPITLSRFAYQLVANAGPSDKPEIQARYIAARAIELEEDNSSLYFKSAQIEKMLNNRSDALKFINRAIELDSNNTEYSDFKKSLLQNN